MERYDGNLTTTWTGLGCHDAATLKRGVKGTAKKNPPFTNTIPDTRMR